MKHITEFEGTQIESPGSIAHLNSNADHLRRVRDTLTTRGWARNALVSIDGYVCLGGAFIAANVSLEGPAAAILVRVIGGSSWRDIPRWNDDQCRTFTEVLEAVRTAIEQA